MGARTVVEKVKSILFSFELLCNTIQLLIANSGNDFTHNRKRILINYPSDPHRTLNINVLDWESALGVASCNSRLTAAQALTSTIMINREDPLLISSKEIAQPLIVTVGRNEIHACLEADIAKIHEESTSHIFNSCPTSPNVFLP